ncbi:molybdopterin converting factor subunit 1 [Effusibacillus lacus]|uniref:Molybdopterin synthase catalytic subunit n=1 Tax=Effusibacillus lacus TaxID=1348429 RepID=A0A292YTU0_9BACL|nr:molybdopterin converting factor subunit 1 [Effusibacillus lacus]TCS76363.1 molybdopterin synthase catalytic subunit [Effusibacillus lacus]GAX91905.1 molybdopterin converting factor [Effusibacillus lacus]
MTLKVRFFAGVAEATGQREYTVSLEEGATVADLLAKLQEAFPNAADLLAKSFFSVNQEYADFHTVIRNGDELAVIPPVSGGSGADARFEITSEPLSADKIIQKVSNPYAGAILTFVGTVREFTHGQRTVLLEYEAYPEMAVKKMAEIAAEIEEKWPGTQVAISHRIGRLEIEEASVMIAVATPHRAASFEAGRYAIERLKQVVPIWKKEIWEDGSEWKGHQQGPWNPLVNPLE